MKRPSDDRLVYLALLALLFIVGFLWGASQGEAAPCKLHCLNKRVGALSSRVSALEESLEAREGEVASLRQNASQLASKVNGLLGCLGQMPVSRYGEEGGPLGYQFFGRRSGGPELFPTTALDATREGTAVGAWLLYNVCQPGEALRPLSNDATGFLQPRDK